jgi:hypothetical protein
MMRRNHKGMTAMAQKSPQMKMLRINMTENSYLWNELKAEDRFSFLNGQLQTLWFSRAIFTAFG